MITSPVNILARSAPSGVGKETAIMKNLEENSLGPPKKIALKTTKSFDFLFSSLKWVENQPNFSHFT